jgi:soluble lytic murein transglycosylase-like protein
MMRRTEPAGFGARGLAPAIVSMMILAGFAGATAAAVPEEAAPELFEVAKRDADLALQEAERGADKARDGNYDSALERYLSALSVDPYNSLARYGLANLIGPIDRPGSDWPPPAPPKKQEPPPYTPSLLPASAPRAVTGGPLFEVSPSAGERAHKAVLRGAERERQRKHKAALELYLEALGADPYNSQARSGLASLIGPIERPLGSWPPAPQAAEQVAEQAAPKRDTTDAAADVTPAIKTARGAVFGDPDAKIRESGLYYRQAKPFLSYVKGSAHKHDIDPRLILALIKVESNFEERTRSFSGARGLMQLMPKTAARFGAKSVDDPEENIEAGTRYLKYLIDLFRGDLDRALAAYNSGEMTVVKHGGVPPNPRVRKFVRDVRAYYQKF